MLYNQKQWQYIQNFGLDSYVGKTIAGIILTESGLLAGAHLVGVGGLKNFLSSNGQIVPQDANQTQVTSYIDKFTGYDLAPITGNTTSGGNFSAGNVGGESLGNTGSLNNSLGNPYLEAGNNSAVDPANAFYAGSGGVSYSDLKIAIQSVIATILFVWTDM